MTLKELRIQSGKSRMDVAAALGVTVVAVGHYERGNRKISLEQVLQLSELFDCTAEEVIRAQLNIRPSDR